MMNEMLEKALKETWENKEMFYENNKNLSMVEIIKKVENKYKEQSPVRTYMLWESCRSKL